MKETTMSKKYDLLVKTGEYDSPTGKKAKYENIGVMMEKDGKSYILLKRTFNPAGVGDATRDNILISLFEPRDNSAASGKPVSETEDQIPF